MQKTLSEKTLSTLSVGDREYRYYSIAALDRLGHGDTERLPRSLKILLENALRHQGEVGREDDVAALAGWQGGRTVGQDMMFRPARTIMPDSSGIPLLADLAAMRDAVAAHGGDPRAVNPQIMADLVVDHSANTDFAGRATAFEQNMAREYEQNGERYAFLRWCQGAFRNLRVVPPGNGICHQINQEYLASVVCTQAHGGELLAYPDSLIGTDSHTPMINSLGVLGWGVGGLDAAAAILGQPISVVIPEVVGCRLTGRLREGITATDVVLTITQRLRAIGVIDKFVEFFGPGIAHLPLSARGTLANMAPEYGATVGYFPIDGETLRYLALTGRPQDQIDLVEAYARAQGLWFDADTVEASYSDVLEIDLGEVETSAAGPRRPHERLSLHEIPAAFASVLADGAKPGEARVAGKDYSLRDGDIVIASITSCTNTANPDVMITAGLLARNARRAGLTAKPWVKASLAPGSRVTADYLRSSGLQDDLDALGFHVTGFGCMTCMGNSGRLPGEITEAVRSGVTVASVLSGNRNFEGRVNSFVDANFLLSPPLVVAYALAGSVRIDLASEPLGLGADGRPIYLRDLWPSAAEVEETIAGSLKADLFERRYRNIFDGDARWRNLPAGSGDTFAWDPASTYIRKPLLFDGFDLGVPEPRDLIGARALAMFGDNVTTDHISPVSAIPADGAAGRYLQELGVAPRDFNTYSARRVHYEVMMRGTFSNKYLVNEMMPEASGGIGRHVPGGATGSLYDIAMRYRQEGVPLVVIAGREYGAGSSRDWAAKGTRLLGVRAVLAEGFERIHRSNLIGMGVLPLQFAGGVTRKTLKLTGDERFDITGIDGNLQPGMLVACTICRPDGTSEQVDLTLRLDSPQEVASYQNGGILHLALRRILRESNSVKG